MISALSANVSLVSFPENEDKEEDNSGWMMVPCQSAKKQKTVKQPVVATRASKRIQRDGCSVLQKAEARVSQRDEATCISNPFDVLNCTSKDDLLGIASSAHISLGENNVEIDNQLDTVLAKELAEAVLVENRFRIKKEREATKVTLESDPIGLASISLMECNEVPGVNDTSEGLTQESGSLLPISPLAVFEDMLDGGVGSGGNSSPKVPSGDAQVKPKRGQGRPKKRK
jgi:hypothetical protein